MRVRVSVRVRVRVRSATATPRNARPCRRASSAYLGGIGRYREI